MKRNLLLTLFLQSLCVTVPTLIRAQALSTIQFYNFGVPVLGSPPPDFTAAELAAYGGVSPCPVAQYNSDASGSRIGYALVGIPAPYSGYEPSSAGAWVSGPPPGTQPSIPGIARATMNYSTATPANGRYLAVRMVLPSVIQNTPLTVWQTKVHLQAGRQYVFRGWVNDLMFGSSDSVDPATGGNTSGGAPAPFPLCGFNTSLAIFRGNSSTPVQVFANQVRQYDNGQVTGDFTPPAGGEDDYTWAIQVTYAAPVTFPPGTNPGSQAVPTAFVGVDDISVTKLEQPDIDDINDCSNNPIVLRVKNAPSSDVTYVWYEGTATGPTNVLANYTTSTYTLNPRPGLGTHYYWVGARTARAGFTPANTTALTRITVYVGQPGVKYIAGPYDFGTPVLGSPPANFTAAELAAYGGVSPSPVAQYNGDVSGYTNIGYALVGIPPPYSAFEPSSALAWVSGPPPGAQPSIPGIARATMNYSTATPANGRYLALRMVLPPAIQNTPLTVWQTKVRLKAGHQYTLRAWVNDLMFGSSDSVDPTTGTNPAIPGSPAPFPLCGFNTSLAIFRGSSSTPVQVFSNQIRQYDNGQINANFTPVDDEEYTWAIQVTYASPITFPPGTTPGTQAVPTAFIGVDDVSITTAVCRYAAPTTANVATCGIQNAIVLNATNNWPNANAPLTAGLSYQWYTQPTPNYFVPIAGATGSSYSVNPPNSLTTTPQVLTYYVAVIGNDGESEKVAVTATFNPYPLELPDLATLPSYLIYPNSFDVSFTGQPNVTYTWAWGDASTPAVGTGTTVSHAYALGSYTLTLTATNNMTGCVRLRTFPISVVNKLCEAVLSRTGIAQMDVELNQRTGTYTFLTQDICATAETAFDCLTGPVTAIPQVVAASAVALSNQLVVADAAYGVSATDLANNPFLVGGGHLSPELTYAYRTEIPVAARNFEAGLFTAIPFNWAVSAQHRLPAWQRAGQATRFSPNGEALEEKDVINNLSTVKYGYGAPAQLMPLTYLTAKNAGYCNVQFESFETMTPNMYRGHDTYQANASEGQMVDLSNSGSSVLSRAHAGRKSWLLGGAKTLTLQTLNVPTPLQGLMLRAWIRVAVTGSEAQALGLASVQTQLTPTVQWGNGISTSATLVSQSGEWVLCEATVDANGLGGINSLTPQLLCTGGSNWQVWVDDVRVQPLGAQMMCYVYDPATLRLLASFDDQHFGLYYQYNAAGSLVRKQAETTRGLKTIQETQYNTVK